MNKSNRTVNQAVAKTIIAGLGGQFATITAIKKDKTLTVINGKVSDSPPSHARHPNLISVKKGGKDNGYRTFDVNNVVKIAFKGQTIEVNRG